LAKNGNELVARGRHASSFRGQSGVLGRLFAQQGVEKITTFEFERR